MIFIRDERKCLIRKYVKKLMILIMEIECKILGELDRPNANGRVYPKAEMQKAIKDYLNSWRHYGELNPNYGELSHNVSLSNISHEIKDINIVGEDVICKIELLDTPRGKIAKDIIKAGQDLKFALRIIAQVEPIKKGPGKHTGETRLKNMQIISIDII